MEKSQNMDEAANGQGKLTRASYLDEWASSMETTMLGYVDKEVVEACSISTVPEKLRKWKVEAYMPQVVSIGPLHKGKRTELLYMEKIKWRCMWHLLHRSKAGPDQALRDCGEAMLMSDEIVRASYSVDDVGFNRHDLAKIMVLDGCFLLELLISGSPDLNDKIKGPSNDPSPGVEVIQRKKVLSDLMMLENQIPLLVLHKLSTTLFPQIFTEGDSIRLIHEHALSILSYCSPDFSNIYSLDFKGFHFLELVHSFIDKEKDEPTADLKIHIGGGEDANINNRKVKLPRCATRLETAGVTIKPLKTQSKAAANMEVVVNVIPRQAEIRFDLKVTFSKNDGKLEIPQLHITETTEAKWRNLIAWELHKNRLEKQNRERAISEPTNEAGISCQFLSYAVFFRSLICCVQDVKLLKDK